MSLDENVKKNITVAKRNRLRPKLNDRGFFAETRTFKFSVSDGAFELQRKLR
jgi:hypothetical protein